MTDLIKAPDVAKRYPPLGRCIYCGATNVELSEEHMVPYHLGARYTLPSSSCEDCSKITSRIEFHCGREIFSDFRHHHKMKSRHKTKPKAVTLIIHGLAGTRQMKVPFESAPHFLVLPEFDQPDIFANRGSTTEVVPRSFYYWAAEDVAERVSKLLRPGDYSWGVQRVADWSLFCRFLAKVALANLAAQLDYPTHKSLLAAVVLGKDRFIRRYIGGKTDLIVPRAPRTGPALPQFTCRTSFNVLTNSVSGRRLLYADLTLFREVGSPTYRLIVGDAPEGTNLANYARAGVEVSPYAGD